jgi:hypothetical protein
VPDLLNRLNMAHAAIDKFRAEIPAIRRAMTRRDVVADTQVEGRTVSNYEAIENSVREAQAEVQDPDAHVGISAITRWSGCYSEHTLGEASRCLLFPLEAHESVHRRACLDYRSERSALTEVFFGRLPIYLIERVNEEIAAYEAEIVELLRLLRALPAACRPNPWVGVIQAFEVKTLHTTQTVQPSNPNALPQVSTTDQQFRRFGTVRYRGQASSASWRSQDITTRHQTSGARIRCTGGLKYQPADRTQTNTHHIESNGAGFSTTLPLVLFNGPAEALEYTISLNLPAMSVRVHQSGYNRSAGGCTDLNDEFPHVHGVEEYEASSPLVVRQPKAPYATTLEGVQRFDMLPFRVEIPDVTSAHTIEVIWHLHKID